MWRKPLNIVANVSLVLLFSITIVICFGNSEDRATETTDVDFLSDELESFENDVMLEWDQLDVDTSWPHPEVYRDMGQLTSIVSPDSDGETVYVLHRADRVFDLDTFGGDNVLRPEYRQPITSNVVAKIVNGRIESGHLANRLYLPHGIDVDSQGNFWIADVGSHQIYKFDPTLSGDPLMTLGERLVPGSDENHFCKPTSVVVASNGFFFVADGYCNSRIMKFYPNGTLFKQWGKKSTLGLTISSFDQPDQFELSVPHQLTLDESGDSICVADREHGRVVCYSAGLNSDNIDDSGSYKYQIGASRQPVYGVTYTVKVDLKSMANVIRQTQRGRQSIILVIAVLELVLLSQVYHWVYTVQCQNERLFLLVVARGMSSKTHIKVYDITKGEVVDMTGNDEYAFRKSHHLSACKSVVTSTNDDDSQSIHMSATFSIGMPSSCLLVVSDVEPNSTLIQAPPTDSQPGNRMWRFLF